MTPGQCRHARELLGWSESDLAGRALISSETIRNLELGRHQPSGSTTSAIRQAFLQAGVEIGPGPDGRVARLGPHAA